MSILRPFALVLILCLLLLLQNSTGAYLGTPSPSPSPVPTPLGAPAPRLDCGAACAARCSKTKRPNLCKRACGSCCFVCNCVPPGTYGNYEACPCYFKLKTRKQIRKCP